MMIKGFERYGQQFDQYANYYETVYGKNISQAKGVMQDHLPETLIDDYISACANCSRIWTNTSTNHHQIICHYKLCINATQKNQVGRGLVAR
jgi:hypothetical protein